MAEFSRKHIRLGMISTTVPGCSNCVPRERGSCHYVDKYFHCPGCDRCVPWCFGCADDLFELCDDCSHHVTTWRKKAETINNAADHP
jgi:hypothetical protein